MEVIVVVLAFIAFVLIANLLSIGKKKEVAEEPKKTTKKKAVKVSTAKECYRDACKQLNVMDSQLRKMRKMATTAQEKKLLSNLESKILNLV